jgi:hypothetical protein
MHHKPQIVIDDILEKYRIALKRLEWALGELEKKPKEIKVEAPIKEEPKVDPQETKAQFGTAFPTYDIWKGDLYRRVDTNPHVTYKWNGVMWMEIPAKSTDRYAYTPEYILFVGEKIETRQYDLDDLNSLEQEAVLQKFNYAVRSFSNKSKK